jgi:integrase/recombinase XerC
MGKGSKERLIPVSSPTLELIAQYQTLKTEQKLSSPTLLCSPTSEPLTPNFVYLSVKKYLCLVTTIPKKSPHILRHSFATHLANNGAELNAIKELLGHSSLASTQVYTHNTIEKLKNIHKLAHPKA